MCQHHPQACVFVLEAEREKYSKLILLVCTDGVSWLHSIPQDVCGVFTEVTAV